MSHPARGAAILEGIRFLEPAVDLVRHHHEYIDGSGYPDGLSGDEISIGARIVAVADAFDAMTSGRVYMQAMGVTRAIEALRNRASKQWDPKVIDALERCMQRIEELAVAAPTPKREAPKDAAAALKKQDATRDADRKLNLDPKLANTASDQLSILSAEIEDEDEFVPGAHVKTEL